MKRVGIITLFGLGNYGNRLQNYAVQKILMDMGFEAKTYSADAYYPKYGYKYIIKKLIHEITGYRFTSSRNAWAESNRKLLFEDFTKNYLPTEKIDDLKTLRSKADYFVLGSDQVWNPLWYHKNDKEIYLLTFANPEQKVCLSPSFGVSELPEEWKPWFKEKLNSFPILNVREHAGTDIIKELTGRDAKVTIDPTLMLDADDWLKIAKKPRQFNSKEPFILTYFLGDRTEKVEEDIKSILKARNMNVLHLLDFSQPNMYECGPQEFIYLFSKADIILTDSFHACVFSFLFNKPFVVYDRVEFGMCEMNSRLESLLSLLGIERKYRDKNLSVDWFDNNYEYGKSQLKIERDKLKSYLTERFAQ